MQQDIPQELTTLLSNPELLRKELAERSLYEFVKQAWHILEPEAFVDGKHIKIICELLEQAAAGSTQNIVINIPPRCMKSLLVSVFFPVWIWIKKQPGARFLTASYSLQLATRDAVKSRRIIESSWFQSRWSDRFKLCDDQNQKTKYENTKGGHRIVCSPDSSTTGEGGDFIIVDDPINAQDGNSENERNKVISWFDEALSSRLNNPSTGVKIIIGQRIHTQDLSGHCLDTGRYEHLCLPMCYEPGAANKYDYRTEQDELLWQERFSQAFIDEQKSNSKLYAGQYQQRPIPDGGTIIKTEWLQYYHQLPERFDTTIQSWDLNFGNSKKSDYVVGVVLGRKGANVYLIDLVRGRWDFPETIKQIKNLSARYPAAITKLVENKANGAALISSLRATLTGLTPVNPSKSKEIRLNAVAPIFESGNFYIPAQASFTDITVAEITGFGAMPNDDIVDAITQGISRLATKSNSVRQYSYKDY